MFRKKILGYFDKRARGIALNYQRAIAELEPAAVHDLRVHLKRLRALFDLVEALAPGFRAKREFKRFRPISRRTRGLRDTQVQIELQARTVRRLRKIPLDYGRYLADLEAAARREFLEAELQGCVDELEGSRERLVAVLQDLSGEVSLARVEARYHGLKADTLELARRCAGDETALHELRTLAKQTHYTFEIVNGCLGRLRPEREFINRMKRLHAMLGDWHDREVAFDYLDGFLRQAGSRALDAACGRLAERLRRDKDRLTLRCRADIDRLKAMLVPPLSEEAAPRPPEESVTPVEEAPGPGVETVSPGAQG